MAKFIVRQLQSDPALAELEIPHEFIKEERMTLDADILSFDDKLASGEYVLVQEDVLRADTREFICKGNKLPTAKYSEYGVVDIEEQRYIKEGIYVVDETWTFDSETNAVKYIDKFKGSDWFNWTSVKAWLSGSKIYQQYLYINDQDKQAEVNI